MARKELYYSVSDTKGRDEGKVFLIKEMSAMQAEWWAIRVCLALGNAGVEIPENIANMGIAGMAVEGLKIVAKIPADQAKPLLDELMTCISFVPNPADKKISRNLLDDDIEEVSTRLKLRAEVFKLHVDFFTAAAA